MAAILVVGAGKPLGSAIVRRLRACGQDVVAAMRTPRRGVEKRLTQAGARVITLNLDDQAGVTHAAQGCRAAVLCPILTTSAPAMASVVKAGVERIVAFSSNNVAIDQTSPVYAGIRDAEASLAAQGLPVALIRPTMIYGHPSDNNIASLLRWADRRRVVPVLGSGRAKQQPVHFADLARLAAELAVQAEPPDLVAAGGPDTVSMTELATLVAQSVRHRAIVLRAPIGSLVWAASAIEALGLRAPITSAQLRRLEQDKTAIGPPPSADLAPRIGIARGVARLAADLGFAEAAPDPDLDALLCDA